MLQPRKVGRHVDGCSHEPHRDEDREQPLSGIQPFEYVAALEGAFGFDGVRSLNRGSLGELYRELDAGIVDIQVNERSNRPSGAWPTYAHCARVLGVDVDAGEIYLENTLRGAAYWIVPLPTFVEAWLLPELSSSRPVRRADAANRWAVFLDRTLIREAEMVGAGSAPWIILGQG